MPEAKAKSKPDSREANSEAVVALDPAGLGRSPRRRWRVLPAAITLATAALAVGLGRAMWDVYMAAPWTRDGTVRAYVVTVAPEVSGRIVELPVADNQFVHKGDLLMVIDPTDYRLRSAAARQRYSRPRPARKTPLGRRTGGCS